MIVPDQTERIRSIVSSAFVSRSADQPAHVDPTGAAELRVISQSAGDAAESEFLHTEDVAATTEAAVVAHQEERRGIVAYRRTHGLSARLAEDVGADTNESRVTS